MSRRIIPILFLCLFSSARAEAGLLRVVRIVDERTLVVGTEPPRQIQLAGIAITDREGARAFLEWALDATWVSGEPRADGYLVWRSPDAMFVNRELVSRGYARATSPDLAPARNFSVTYLGELLPFGPQQRQRATASAPPGTGSGSAAPRPARPRQQPPQSRRTRAAQPR
jgi:hypothetical protein